MSAFRIVTFRMKSATMPAIDYAVLTTTGQDL